MDHEQRIDKRRVQKKQHHFEEDIIPTYTHTLTGHGYEQTELEGGINDSKHTTNSRRSFPMTLRTTYLDYKKPDDCNDNNDGKKIKNRAG